MTTPPAHVYEIEIAAPPEAVWRAITEGDLTRRYFYETVVVSGWQTGSPIVYTGADGNRIVEGEVLACDPPRRLSYTWHALWSAAVAAEKPSRVTWELTRTPGGTRVALVHDEFDGETAVYHEVGGGWPGILERLKLVVEEAAQRVGGA